MTLKQLEYFLAIAETENITKAAINLNISQPPLSQSLKALEKEFDIELFKREKKRMIITEKGLLLQERAKEILSLINETIADLQAEEAEKQEIIRIGTITSACNQLLPQRIKEFLEIEPNVHFDIVEGSTASICALLSIGSVDLGIVREPFNLHDFHSILLENDGLSNPHFDSFVTMAKPSFYKDLESPSIDLAELKNTPLIVHHRYRELITNNCRQKGFIPKFFCLNNDLSSSLSWAEQGLGVAIVPYTSSLLKNDSDMVVKTITSPTISSCAYIIWNSDSPLSVTLLNFIQFFNNQSLPLQ